MRQKFMVQTRKSKLPKKESWGKNKMRRITGFGGKKGTFYSKDSIQ